MSVVQVDPITGNVFVSVARRAETHTEPHANHADLIKPSDDPSWIESLPEEEREAARERSRKVQEDHDTHFPLP